MNEPSPHVATSVDFYDILNERGYVVGTKCTFTCACGDIVNGGEYEGPTRTFLARRDAETLFRQHRDFEDMHVGLFEEMP